MTLQVNSTRTPTGCASSSESIHPTSMIAGSWWVWSCSLDLPSAKYGWLSAKLIFRKRLSFIPFECIFKKKTLTGCLRMPTMTSWLPLTRWTNWNVNILMRKCHSTKCYGFKLWFYFVRISFWNCCLMALYIFLQIQRGVRKEPSLFVKVTKTRDNDF